MFDHLNGRRARTEFLDELIQQGHTLACCPVNITEVYAGLRPGEEAKTQTFINSLEYLPISQPSPGKPVCCAVTGVRRDKPSPTRMSRSPLLLWLTEHQS